jgi:hypothetical protein
VERPPRPELAAETQRNEKATQGLRCVSCCVLLVFPLHSPVAFSRCVLPLRSPVAFPIVFPVGFPITFRFRCVLLPLRCVSESFALKRYVICCVSFELAFAFAFPWALSYVLFAFAFAFPWALSCVLFAFAFDGFAAFLLRSPCVSVGIAFAFAFPLRFVCVCINIRFRSVSVAFPLHCVPLPLPVRCVALPSHCVPIMLRPHCLVMVRSPCAPLRCVA